MGKSRRQLADEAWLRVNTPDSGGGLPGQLDIEAAIAAALAPEPVPEMLVSLDGIPPRCPACNRAMTILHGWAYSKPPAEPTIQCPECGKRFTVSAASHATYRAQVQNAYALLPKAPPVTKKSKRSRGAR